jgi:hypothetical protein
MWAVLERVWTLPPPANRGQPFSSNRNQNALFHPQVIAFETMAFGKYPLFRIAYYYYDLYPLFKTG